MIDSSLKRHALGVVALFAVVGVGIGLAMQFSLAFLIEWQVDPGTNPTSNTLVGLTLIQGILFPLTVGPLVAAIAGVGAGYSLDDRHTKVAAVGGTCSAVGFVVMTMLSVFLTVVVLSIYAGGGGAEGFPMNMLFTAILETTIPVGIVGAGTAYLGSRFA